MKAIVFRLLTFLFICACVSIFPYWIGLPLRETMKFGERFVGGLFIELCFFAVIWVLFCIVMWIIHGDYSVFEINVLRNRFKDWLDE